MKYSHHLHDNIKLTSGVTTSVHPLCLVFPSIFNQAILLQATSRRYVSVSTLPLSSIFIWHNIICATVDVLDTQRFMIAVKRTQTIVYSLTIPGSIIYPLIQQRITRYTLIPHLINSHMYSVMGPTYSDSQFTKLRNACSIREMTVLLE